MSKTTVYSSAPILIASDVVADAEKAKKLLDREYQHVFVSTDAHKMVKDFEWHKPQVLVLAFNALEKAECYVRELQDTSTQLPLRQYRSVILCNQNEVEQVCCMCQQKYFDDYVLFWPKIHDAQRLAMAVHGVLLEHSLFNSSEPSATDFAVHTRSLANLCASCIFGQNST